jgi:hypothetical protein
VSPEEPQASPVVIIDPGLWTDFTLWAHGRGLSLTEIAQAGDREVYRLHRERDL